MKEKEKEIEEIDIPEKRDLNEATGPPHVGRLHHILLQQPCPTVSQHLHSHPPNPTRSYSFTITVLFLKKRFK